jgi:Galactose oxidase, central domain/Kelch motif
MKRPLLLSVSACVSCVLGGCGGGGTKGSQVPIVNMWVSSKVIALGQPVTLGWSSSYATSCAASATPTESDWSGTELMSGSQSVTPVSQGAVTYTLVCTSAGGSTSGSASVTATANTSSNLTITSGPLPDGIVGQQYGTLHSLTISTTGNRVRGKFFQLSASGGTGQYRWSWAAAPSSSLPPHMGCCQATFGTQIPMINYTVYDAVTGTPIAPGTYQVIVTVNDSGTPPAITSANYTININDPPPPVVNTTPAPAIGTLNVAYVGSTFTATNGLSPFTWSETGALPPGMSFSSGGVLSGTPTQAGSFNIAVGVQDSLGRNAAPQDFTIVVLSKGFTPTGSMGSGRDGHTATLLNTGKVLVTGGASATADLATAELFDPTAGSFSPTGSMESTRISHTATLLSDGKVLITGGYGGGATFATAEIFDPASGSFTPTGSMGTARAYHTATLLSNGKVLVTGGLDAGQNALASAEIFDPTSGIFASTASMETGRLFHTATLLNNGNVLVAGGGNATAELFDPTTGSFIPTGSMGSARSLHAATLENGKVLVTGGYDAGAKAVATAELFDPASSTFTPTGSMGTARYLHTTTLLSDGKVLVAGGFENASGPTPLSAAELFDPSSGTFTATADMSAARTSHTATLLTNGEVLVTGGQGVDAGVSTVLATAELYQ